MKWGLYGLSGLLGFWLATGPVSVSGAENDSSTLPYLQQHTEDWPKQVALQQPVIFKVILDGKAAGIATLPAGAEADLVSVAPEGLGLVSGTNQATVMPEQTDLWARVKAIRDVRASFPDPSANDPAVSLQLPPNSASADWYHQQLLEKIDPWLAKYPMSPLFDQMQVRRTTFYAESVRVEGGDIRRGTQWYSAEEAAEKGLDFQAEDLLAQLGGVSGGAAADLEKLIAQIPQYAKTDLHPALVRAALAAIDTLSVQDAAARQALQPLRESLGREPVAEEEKVLRDLQGAAAVDPLAALPVLQKVEAVWPGNEPADRVALNKAEEALRQIDGAIAAAKISEASEKEAAVQKLIAFPASTPQLDRLKQASDDLAPQLSAAVALEQAYADRQYDRVAAAPAISPAFQPWQAALARLIARQKADSHAAIEEIEPSLFRCDPRGALAASRRAKALWPANPEVAAASRMLWIAAAAAALVVIGFLMVVWERLATLVDHLLFKRRMKSSQSKS